MELTKLIGAAALALIISLAPVSTVRAQISVPNDPQVRAQFIALLTQQIQLLYAQIADLKGVDTKKKATKKESALTRLKDTTGRRGSADIAVSEGAALKANTGYQWPKRETAVEETSPIVEVVSSDIDDEGNFEVKISVQAPRSEDYYVPTSVSQAVRYDITPKFEGTKRDALTSSAKKVGDAYRIQEGETETFKLSVRLTGSGTYAVELESLKLRTEVGSTKTYEPKGGTYRTDAITL